MKPVSLLAVSATLLFAAMALLPVQSFTTATTTAPVSLGEVVYAVPLRKQVPIEQVQQEWYHEYLDPTTNDSLFAPLFEKIRDKTLAVFQPTFPFTEKMNPDSAIKFLDVPFTYSIEDPNTFEPVEFSAKETKYPNSVVAIIFHEEWMYDAPTLSLKKIVKGIIPVMEYGWLYTEEFTGPILKPTFYIPFPGTGVAENGVRVNEVTYNMQHDSVPLLDYGGYDRYVTRSATKSPDCSKTMNGLMATLKQQCAAKTTALFRSAYPFNAEVAKKDKAGVVASVNESDILRFHETWNTDFSTMTFTKEVRGVLFGNEFTRTEEPGGYNVYITEQKFDAYLPLNGNLPVAPGSMRSVGIENISYGATYQQIPWIIYPQFSTKDSVALATLTQQVAKDAQKGAFPVYDKEELWKFDNPLDKRRVSLNAKEIDSLFYRYDVVMVEVGEDLEERVLKTPQDPTEYGGFRYFESWYFDPVKMIFRKQIKSVGLLRFATSSYGEVRGLEPMFMFDNARDSIFQPKFLVGRNIQTPVLLNLNEWYPDENESGALIVGHGAGYDQQISNENRYLLVQQVINSVLSGKIIAWTTGKSSKQFTIPQFRAMLDTATSGSGAHPPVGLEYYVFNELTFDEDWYHNPATGQFYKHVNAITFGRRPYLRADPNTGEIMPEPVYFTIKVNGTK